MGMVVRKRESEKDESVAMLVSLCLNSTNEIGDLAKFHPSVVLLFCFFYIPCRLVPLLLFSALNFGLSFPFKYDFEYEKQVSSFFLN